MILKGNRRGGAADLARHLLKDENDHVELHELRGFVSTNLTGALNETYAISRGTRCKKFMYSLSVNPPPNKAASKDDILRAVEDAEKTLKLRGQPRAIVFHEKGERRHAHVVWSLINTKEMKAVRLRNDRLKLQPLTRQLFIRHGREMPKGLLDRTQRDPRSYTLKEYHKARKTRRNARDIKDAIQTAWAISDSKTAFAQALEERGFKLARGDRAAIVAVDMFGESHALPRALSLTVKEVRKRLGDERKEPDKFMSVDEAKRKTAAMMLVKLSQYGTKINEAKRQSMRDFETRRAALVERQRAERRLLAHRREERWARECRIRQDRFRKGFKRLWDCLTGEHRRIRKINEREAADGLVRDRDEQETLVQTQLAERNRLKIFRMEQRQELTRERRVIGRDKKGYETIRGSYSHDGPSQ